VRYQVGRHDRFPRVRIPRTPAVSISDTRALLASLIVPVQENVVASSSALTLPSVSRALRGFDAASDAAFSEQGGAGVCIESMADIIPPETIGPALPPVLQGPLLSLSTFCLPAFVCDVDSAFDPSV